MYGIYYETNVYQRASIEKYAPLVLRKKNVLRTFETAENAIQWLNLIPGSVKDKNPGKYKIVRLVPQEIHEQRVVTRTLRDVG